MRVENRKSIQISEIVNVEYVNLHEFYFKYFHAKHDPKDKDKENIGRTSAER